MEVKIIAEGAELQGTLVLPPGTTGVVVFAHGSGSSRHSPRNRYVAEALQRAGLGTLLLDLLTEDEEAQDTHIAAWRFDVPLLATRLEAAITWLTDQPGLASVQVGLFGASTGAAAALVAAAHRPEAVEAVVCRGGRPDLAGDALPRVKAPTLLVVGGADPEVLALNRQALARMEAPGELQVVPGATHLFEEPGTLEVVARLASAWFVDHLLRTGSGFSLTGEGFR